MYIYLHVFMHLYIRIHLASHSTRADKLDKHVFVYTCVIEREGGEREGETK